MMSTPDSSTGIPFWRLSGNGNDFLALAEPRTIPDGSTIRAWCRRGLGLGADGLFTLERTDGRVRMRYWNADGGEAELCLNGVRCAVRLAAELGWFEDRLELDTGAGTMYGRRTAAERVSVEAPVPAEPASAHRLDTPLGPLVVYALRIGVPHVVVLTDRGLGDVPLGDLGPFLRHHPTFAPAGTNVNVVRCVSPERLELRTWERGVEDETLACGTGILASVHVAMERRLCRLPVRIQTAGGFPTTVDGEVDDGTGRPRRWWLDSDARLVARGVVLEGAREEAAAVRWSP